MKELLLKVTIGCKKTRVMTLPKNNNAEPLPRQCSVFLKFLSFLQQILSCFCHFVYKVLSCNFFTFHYFIYSYTAIHTCPFFTIHQRLQVGSQKLIFLSRYFNQRKFSFVFNPGYLFIFTNNNVIGSEESLCAGLYM